MNGPLGGRTAVVTGASRGIGLAITRALIEAGARVAMLARNEEVLTARAQELGTAALAIACDVGDRARVADAASRIEMTFDDGPDILVNNAGFFALEPLAETDPERFVTSVEVNLIAPFLLIRRFLPAMIARRRGDIVTIGSVADRQAFPENGAYAASKYGARAMHEVMCSELRGTGVRAALISPGPTDTGLWNSIDTNRPGFTPRARMLRAEAVASAVLYTLTRPPDVTIDELRLSSS
ncbi:MAG TPA: SDR family oxidoreductase [Gemmatimonadaceae bacterium]|nr:SDR family oxidoreductase [Gemmatimonadaceae bacterium]